MTQLQKNALGRVPLSAEEVERLYASTHLHPMRPFERLCESHERLRMEAEGFEAVIVQLEKALAEAKETMLALGVRCATQSDLLSRRAEKAGAA